MGEENSAASSGLFAVFVLSIYSLVLIPFTIYRLCNASDEVTTQPVVKVRGLTAAVGLNTLEHLASESQQLTSRSALSLLQSKKQPGFADRLKGLCTKRKSNCSCSAVDSCRAVRSMGWRMHASAASFSASRGISSVWFLANGNSCGCP
jgi:hypothetical protein